MAEGTISGTMIADLPRSSYAYCEPNDGPCHFPIKDKDGKPDAAHVRNALARLSQSPFGDKARPAVEAAAKELGIGEPAARSEDAPRYDLVRSLAPTIDYGDGDPVRSISVDGDEPGSGYLRGRFAVFDVWTEVRSMFEGHFMERVGEHAFRKTLTEKRPKIILEHGMHPVVGKSPIAPTEEVGTDQRGGFYGGPLLEGVPQLVVSGLRADLYGSSYRFDNTRPPEVNVRPRPSDYNPKGLPEVTVREAGVKEFGPTSFPVYRDTSASVRSETDEFMLGHFGDPEKIRAFLAAQGGPIAPPTLDAGASHLEDGRRAEPPPEPNVLSHPPRFRSRDEWLASLTKVRSIR